MTDPEIRDYLRKHCFAVDAQDCLMKVFNTSRQIVSGDYNSDTGMMKITTPDNTFTFKWILGSP